MTTTTSSVPTNIVTQALANVEASVQSVASATGLPPQVATVQAQAVAAAQQAVPPVQTLKQQVQQFVAAAGPLIDQALTALGGPTPGAASGPVTSMQVAATTLAVATKAASQQLGTARDNCNTAVAAMNGAAAALDSQIAAAKAQAAADQQQVDSLNSKKLYWLALGPLGAIGLAIIIPEIVSANNTVASIQAQINALAQQAAQAAKMKIDVQQLSTNVAALVTRIQDLQNAVDYVCGDVGNVMKDLTDATTSAQAKIFLLTVKGELATLGAETA